MVGYERCVDSLRLFPDTNLRLFHFCAVISVHRIDATKEAGGRTERRRCFVLRINVSVNGRALKYHACSPLFVAKNNSRLRRAIVRILFNSEGGMTRSEVSEQLHEMGLFREAPTESSLAALISKNAQVVKVGYAKVELSNGLTVRNMVFDVDRNLIRSEEDIDLTMPYSSMTKSMKEKAKRCPTCRQLRIIPETEHECLSCQRRV